MGNMVANGLTMVGKHQSKKEKYEAANADSVFDSVAKQLKKFDTQIEEKATLAALLSWGRQRKRRRKIYSKQTH